VTSVAKSRGLPPLDVVKLHATKAPIRSVEPSAAGAAV